MKVSVVQIAMIYEAFEGIEAAKSASSDAEIVAAFARLASACDGIVRSGWLGWTRRLPSRMTIFEFLTFLKNEFPKYGECIAEDRSLIDKLKLVKITQT